MTRLSRPVTRRVPTLSFGDLVVTLAEEGIYLRQPRRRTSFLLPYGVAFQRAAALHVDRERRERRQARRT